MAMLEPTTRETKRSKNTSTPPRSSGGSHSAPSPELLQTIQALQSEIAELKTKRDMTKDEKTELEQVKADLAAARADLKATTPASTPATAPARTKRVVNFGTFQVEEDVD